MPTCLVVNRKKCWNNSNCNETCKADHTCGVVMKNDTDGGTGLEIQIAGCLAHSFCPTEVESSDCFLQHSKRTSTFDIYSCCCTDDFCNNNTIHNATLMRPKITKTTTTIRKSILSYILKATYTIVREEKI